MLLKKKNNQSKSGTGNPFTIFTFLANLSSASLEFRSRKALVSASLTSTKSYVNKA